MLGSQIELLLGDVPGVDRGGDLLGRHRPDTLHGRDRRSGGGAPYRLDSSGVLRPPPDDPDDVAAAFRWRGKAAPQVPLGASIALPPRLAISPMASVSGLIGLTLRY